MARSNGPPESGRDDPIGEPHGRRGRSDSSESWVWQELYPELQSLAKRFMMSEHVAHTLQPTALINEVYLKFSDADRQIRDKREFLCAAARCMRELLVDHARKKGRQKRGGGWQRVSLEHDAALPETLELDESTCDALEELAAQSKELARVFELRYFAGLSIEQVAETLGVSRRTVDTRIASARALLKRYMDPNR